MHPVVAPPGIGDIFALIEYVLGHPYLFIGSTTVMTTSLVLAAIALSIGTLAPSGSAIARASGPPLDWLAPKLSLVLAYFGVGAMALATHILIRFHQYIPMETELQFRSGIGHAAVAVIGIVLLAPRLRGMSARSLGRGRTSGPSATSSSKWSS